MNLELSINTENQEDISKALNILNSLSNTKSIIPMPEVVPEREYICKTSVGFANILEEDEGVYRILAGSIVAKDTSPSCSAKAKRMREELICKGIIEIVEEKGIVRKDIGDLLSKSLVASIVTGTNTNGNARLIEKEYSSKNYCSEKEIYSYTPFEYSNAEYEELCNIYRESTSFFDFIARDDIPESILNIYDFKKEGLGVLEYDFHVTFFQDRNKAHQLIQSRKSREGITLLECVAKAYAWYSDFYRYLCKDDTPQVIIEHLTDSASIQEHKEILDALKECLLYIAINGEDCDDKNE